MEPHNKGKFGEGKGYRWFISHVGHIGEKCLIWPHSCCTAGYGSFMFEKKLFLAHREMCRITHGKPPSPGLHAAHSCGNRRCVNPKHLSWKTPGENQLDRRIHGTRMTKRRKLTQRQADQIRQLKGKERDRYTSHTPDLKG